MIARSLNRLNRNGSTAAVLSGPPRLNRTTARRLALFSAAPTMHRLDELAHMFRRRLLKNPVPQVEDQRPAAERSEDPQDFAAHRISAEDKQKGIEIALEGHMGLQLAGRPIQRQAAVQAEAGQSRDA